MREMTSSADCAELDLLMSGPLSNFGVHTSTSSRMGLGHYKCRMGLGWATHPTHGWLSIGQGSKEMCQTGPGSGINLETVNPDDIIPK